VLKTRLDPGDGGHGRRGRNPAFAAEELERQRTQALDACRCR
jgi:hypothetical protein